jgi:hypothetical protein
VAPLILGAAVYAAIRTRLETGLLAAGALAVGLGLRGRVGAAVSRARAS